MARLTGFAAAAILGLTVGSASAQVLPAPVRQQAGLTLGGIQGVVVDDHGGPIADAMVSALGLTSAMATTDARGRFVIQPLPSGQYRPSHQSHRLCLDAPRRRTGRDQQR